MRSFFVALVLGLVLASAFTQEVVVLSSDNFDETIAKHDVVLVEFFAPWCGHCKALAPKFVTAAETLVAEGITNSILASVDCTVETELAQRYEIQGYPTLIAFKKDPTVAIPYNGAREVDALVNFIKKKSVPAVIQVSTVSELDALAKGSALVLFGGSDDDVAVFSAAADVDEIFSFYVVSDSSIASTAGAATPSIKMFRSFSDSPAVFTDFPLTADGLKEFIEAEGFPPVNEITQDNYQRLSKRPYPLVILVFDMEVEEQKTKWFAVLNKLAAEFPQLSVTYGPANQLSNAVKQFGGSGEFLPSVIGFVVPAVQNSPLPPRFAWPEDTELNEDNLRTWFQTVVDGNPLINKKSEPVPEDNSGPVRVLVASTFEEEVLKSGKYVLVEFYAPWCGHCKALAGTYDEVGRKFAGNDKVVIAKIDATENWTDPTYNIQGFPTILLFKPDGSRVSFEGERVVESFVEFVESNIDGGADSDSASKGHDEL